MNKNLNTKTLGASFDDVLELAGLQEAYYKFKVLVSQAEGLFINGNTRDAFNVLYSIWVHPSIVPALLLRQCFENRCLILPSWKNSGNLYVHYIPKKAGGFRTIFIPKENTRICMGVINTIIQSVCKSWSNRTVGFRPGSGTHAAIGLLADTTRSVLQLHGCAYIVFFDLHKAFNSVNMKHLAHSLQLNYLPHDIKKYFWRWQHLLPVNNNLQCGLSLNCLPIELGLKAKTVGFDGLAQGFSYSPTLFAWYLDSILIKQTSLIAYADNIVGVFSTEREAMYALEHAKYLLKPSGLCINDNSIQIVALNAKLNIAEHIIPWLGHGLSLPDCNVYYSQFEQKGTHTIPMFISKEEWQIMLHCSNWVKSVHNIKWRCF